MTASHVVALSGGKDSTCLGMALAEYEPRDYTYIWTPTGDELPEVYEHVRLLEAILCKPILRLGIGKTLMELIDELEMLPNFRARWCTRILKIEPAIEFMATLEPGSVMYVGLRADEESREGLHGDDVISDFPFKRWGWKLADIKNYLAIRGIKIPARTDCAVCYHQRIVEWRNLWRDHPERFQQGVDIETKHGHTFRTPGRDTWPVALVDMRKDFEKGRRIRGEERQGEICSVCSK